MSTIPTLTRQPGWPERLVALIEDRRRTPFAWGVHDCCLFAADAVLAITGTDLAADWRGTYSSEHSAARMLQQQGGCEALVARHLPAYTHPLMAHRGDVVCVDLEGRATLGVVVGNGFWAAPGEHGLVMRPMAEVQRVYAVG